MRAPESVLFSNIGATTSTFKLMGGKYMICLAATGSGTVKLQKVGPDGSTVLDMKAPFNNAGTEVDLVIGTLAVNSCKNVDVPPGDYQFTTSGFTAIYVEIVRIPGE